MKRFSLFAFIPLTLFSLTTCHAHDDQQWRLSADLLIWTAKEAGADNWAEEITTEGLLLPSRANRLREVQFPWDPGVRVSAVYQPCCCDWDTRFSYTRFNTQGKDNAAGAPGSIHSTFLGNFYVGNTQGLGISGPSYQSAGIRWGIDFNILDWDIGWNFCLGEAVECRPFVGLKGGGITQSIYSTWEYPTADPPLDPPDFTVGTENIRNNFWGVGIQAGADFKWRPFCCSYPDFYLFGDFSGAILYGHWSFSDRFRKDTGSEVVVSVESLMSSSAMVRSFMGCAWECFKSDQLQFSIRVGFEMQVWLDQLRFYSFTGGRLGNQLSLQGGTIEFNFGF